MRRPRVSDELSARIDVVRGGVPFERWVRGALEAQLDEAGMDALPVLSMEELVAVQRESNVALSARIEAKHALGQAGPRFGSDAGQAAALDRQARLNKAKGL